VFSNALLAVSLWTVKEWLLSQNVGAFWVLMRILACGALGLGLKEIVAGDAPKAFAAASSAKVLTSFVLWFRFTDELSSVHGIMTSRTTVVSIDHRLLGSFFSPR
jgi:zinc transporter 5/7